MFNRSLTRLHVSAANLNVQLQVKAAPGVLEIQITKHAFNSGRTAARVKGA